MKKDFNNFEELNNELEILKLERELQWRKLTQTFSSTTEKLTPNNFAKTAVSSALSAFTPSAGKSVIVSLILKFIINRLFKRQ